LESGIGPQNTADFLVMVIDRLLDRMGDVIAEIDEQVDDLQSHLGKETGNQHILYSR
jgi:Mg2+ and Co2+ transporter CorA